MGFLGELKKGARLAENPKGYVIDAIKRKLKEIELKSCFSEQREQLFSNFKADNFKLRAYEKDFIFKCIFISWIWT